MTGKYLNNRFTYCAGTLAAICIALDAFAATPMDLNGDGKSEILWENMATGHSYVWALDAPKVTSEGVLPVFGDSNWRIAGVSDANGDGKADLLWRNTVTGQNYLWLMNGLDVQTQAPLPSLPLAWRVVGFVDVTGDGRADLIWRNMQTGENYAWALNGGTVTSEGPLPTVPLAWTAAATGDVNADGRADIFWRNQATGDNYIWTLDGFAVTSETALPSMPADWQLAGVGDYNADGRTDVIWRHGSTGENYAWFMNGTSIGAQGYLPTVADANWKMTAFGDYNGDGLADILWRHATTGDNYIWLMNGATLVSDAFLPGIPDDAWTSRIVFPAQVQTAQAATGGSGGSSTATTSATTTTLGSASTATSSASGSGSASTPGSTTLAASSSRPSSAGSNVCVTSAGSGPFDLCFNNTENLSATRMLTFKVNNASRTIDLSTDLKVEGSGPLTLTTTGPTTVTLPTSGKLLTEASGLPLAGGTLTGGLGFTGNQAITFSPTGAFDWLRINNPVGYGGGRYFQGLMQHALNPGGGFNNVVKYGYNIDGVQTPSLPGLWYAMEPDYRPGSNDRWVESHMSVYHPNLGNGTGGEIRLFSHTFQYQPGQTAAQTGSTWDFRANNGLSVSKLTGTPYFYALPTNLVWTSRDGSSGIKFGGTTLGTPSATNISTTTITPALDGGTFRGLDFGNDWATVSMRVPLVSGGFGTFDNRYGSKLQVAGKLAMNSDFVLYGNGRRIVTDSALVVTEADHPLIQSGSVNGYTALGMMPNGTDRGSYFFLFNSSTPNDSARLMLATSATAMAVVSGTTGSGTLLPIDFRMNASTKLRLHTDGRLSVGGTANDNTHQLQLTGAMAQTSYTQFAETAKPAPAPANTVRLYAKDDGTGKTQLCAMFATGEQCFVTQP
jgi:hypothetical protein